MISGSWTKKIFQWMLHANGWTLSGSPPDKSKYIIIVAPHTSNVDFILGIAAKFATGLNVKYLGKEVLFQPPWGWLFYRLGGYPVKREKHYNQVDHIVSLINNADQFILGIAPEGTRSSTGHWKTGFYWIARLANVPIVMVSFDYSKKSIAFSPPFYPTKNMETDLLAMKSFFKDVRGLRQMQ